MNPQFESTADGLAEKGFAIIDGFLDPNEVNAILELPGFKENMNGFKLAGVGNHHQLQINEAVRGDYIQWIDNISAPAVIKVYVDRIQRLRVFLNRALFLSLADLEAHMTIYPPGAFYKRHLDQFKKEDHRKLSIICYLNNDWTMDHGGQLRMFTEDGEISVLPLAGRLVCFRSDQIEHEVLPATRQRLSLTGWMLDKVVNINPTGISSPDDHLHPSTG